ncbi:MAG: hypothetical protein VZR33_09765 [Methanosphaera sp.]|nr:hypothetical protein [Methanosphaera sp.]
MKKGNYMDDFSSPEEFIKHQILAKGNFSSLDKKLMYKLIRENKIDFQLNRNGLAYTKKSEMLDALLKKVSYRELAKYVDVSRDSFCAKFGITVEQFEVLVKKGLVHRTNEHLSVRNATEKNEKWSRWYGYNVYDYFELTEHDVIIAISE